jgi:hypothetical protein
MTPNAAAPPSCAAYSVEPDLRLGAIAVCTCGWRSSGAPSGGVAGAQWDAHSAEEAAARRVR